MTSKSASTGRKPSIQTTAFGTTQNGKDATLISLTNSIGLTAQFSDYGGTWVSMMTPDINGQLGDILLGFNDVSGYEENPFFSCIVGRYANRIAGGKFSMDGTEHQLDLNEPPNQLHGGTENLSCRFWRWETDKIQNLIRFSCESPDGASGYPGNLKLEVSYQLNDLNELIIQYTASTDKPTHINLTNHAYFNLGDSATIAAHELQLDADKYTPVDQNLIPTGEIVPTPKSLEFSNAAIIGEKIRIRQNLGEDGLDHNLVFNNWSGNLVCRGQLQDPKSGRTMSIKTTEPGIQIYTGNHLNGIIGKQKRVYLQHGGVCLETQHFPDSPNQPHFPTTTLSPDRVFSSTTIYQFGSKKANP